MSKRLNLRSSKLSGSTSHPKTTLARERQTSAMPSNSQPAETCSKSAAVPSSSAATWAGPVSQSTGTPGRMLARASSAGSQKSVTAASTTRAISPLIRLGPRRTKMNANSVRDHKWREMRRALPGVTRPSERTISENRNRPRKSHDISG